MIYSHNVSCPKYDILFLASASISAIRGIQLLTQLTWCSQKGPENGGVFGHFGIYRLWGVNSPGANFTGIAVDKLQRAQRIKVTEIFNWVLRNTATYVENFISKYEKCI